MARKPKIIDESEDDFFSDLKENSSDNAQFASDGVSGDVTSFIDTGSYILNAQLAGSLYHGGVASNKITAFGGPESVGKSFFTLDIARAFQRYYNDEALIKEYETEGGRTTQLLTQRGFPLNRHQIEEVNTIEEFRTSAVRFLDWYKERIDSGKKVYPTAITLDSLSNLSSIKEIEDMTNGDNKRDMTKQQLIRGAFRVITLKASKLNIPLFVTNHIYAVVGAYVPTNEMSGGRGLKYSASTICFLNKTKDKDEKTKEITGNIITVTLAKSRFTKEYTKVDVKLDYKTGLDRYYGLLPIAEKYGIAKKKAKGYEWADGSTVYERDLEMNPKQYYTKDILDRLEVACKEEFCFGSNSAEDIDEEVEALLENE